MAIGLSLARAFFSADRILTIHGLARAMRHLLTCRSIQRRL
ncbi:MAG: hypothetical protein ACK587_05140 [Cyanobacteriota bacterium]